MKRIACTILLLWVASCASVSAFAVQAPAKHFHAHVISNTAKYSYKAGKKVVKEVRNPIVYVGKQIV